MQRSGVFARSAGKRRSTARSGIDFSKRGGLKILLMAGLVSVALTGCASTAVVTGPTKAASTTSASPTPVRTAQPQNKFPGTANYAAFEGFADKDTDTQDAACAEFFSKNMTDKTTVSKTSTGPEVAKWYADRIDLKLMLEVQADDHNEKLIRINPDGVTRYSDGIFPAQGKAGGPYYAFSIEGHLNDFANRVVNAIYEWHDSEAFPSFKMTADLSVESMLTNGIPPIAVDRNFANHPWSDFNSVV